MCLWFDEIKIYVYLLADEFLSEKLASFKHVWDVVERPRPNPGVFLLVGILFYWSETTRSHMIQVSNDITKCLVIYKDHI